jgi:hypothetical protein
MPTTASETSAASSVRLSLGDGTVVDGTPIVQGDTGGAFCAGIRAVFHFMRSDALDRPDGHYLPFPSDEELRGFCDDLGPLGLGTTDQAFCRAWSVYTILWTSPIAESPDIPAVEEVLSDACMGAYFASSWDGTPAYEQPIYEHTLFGEGFICYPVTSELWAGSLDAMPHVVACPIGFDTNTGELSLSIAFLDFLTVARLGTTQEQRDEAWFYEVYLGAADVFSELIQTSILGEDEAILGGDTFCGIIARNRESGDSPRDGTLTAIAETGFLLGIADSHSTFLGVAAAGVLCDEASYQYVLEFFEEAARE